MTKWQIGNYVTYLSSNKLAKLDLYSSVIAFDKAELPSVVSELDKALPGI
jgi:hypothetical protein